MQTFRSVMATIAFISLSWVLTSRQSAHPPETIPVKAAEKSLQNTEAPQNMITRFIQPAAEYEKVESVILSEYLFGETTGGHALTDAIIEAGAEVFILTNDVIEEAQRATWLTDLNIKRSHWNRVVSLGVPHESYWVRDFGPQPLKLSTPGNESAHQEIGFADFLYRHENTLDDTVPYQIAMYLKKSVLHIPFDFDGGNFMSNGSTCLMTDDYRFTGDLRTVKKGVDRSDDLRTYLGCENLVIISYPAHEHIDMWVKVTSEGRLLLNEITQKQLDFARFNLPQDYEEILAIKTSLDRASLIIQKHFQITRIPMPLPYGGVFRTYTNSVLVNKTAIIPSYDKDFKTGRSYLDHSINGEMEKQVAALYAAAGYKTVFINSDELISNGGALHCVTSQVPERLMKQDPMPSSHASADKEEEALILSF